MGILIILNFTVPFAIQFFTKPPQEALDKAEMCKKATNCGENDGAISACYYQGEIIKCPTEILYYYQYGSVEQK